MSLLQFFLEFQGIFLSILTVAFFHFFQKNKNKESKILAVSVMMNGFVLFWDIMAYSQQGVATAYGFFMHYLANFFLYSMEYAVSVLFLYYLYIVLKRYTEVDHKIFKVMGIMIVGILFPLLVANLFTGWYYFFDVENYYHRGPLFMVNVIVQVIPLAAGTILFIRHRKELPSYLSIAMVLYITFPLGGILLQSLFFGFSFFNVMTAISTICVFGINVYEMNLERKREERLFLETKTGMLSAQINPHFMFNSLSVIYYLMDDDVEQAKEGLMHFTKYLRGSIETDLHKDLISVKKELEFVNEYASLEKLRFEDKIEVVYDIQDTDVRIPYLTIEPLVENAIKHGIKKKKGKGTVKVSTCLENGVHVITVSDDGVGFDMTEVKPKKEGSGIGVENIRERIKVMCRGTVEITSEVGVGTSVVIRIPEKGMSRTF